MFDWKYYDFFFKEAYHFRSFCSYLKLIITHCPPLSHLDCDINNVCPDISECSLCLNGGTCQDVIDGYSCLCMSGYTGVHCETNINECQGIDCKVSHLSFNWLLCHHLLIITPLWPKDTVL